MPPTKTSGEKLHTFEATGISIIEARYRPGQRITRHCHENAEVSLVLDGEFEEVVLRSTFGCGRMNALLRPAEAEHVNRYGARGAHCLIVEFRPMFAEIF